MTSTANATSSIRAYARSAGLLYLAIIVCGIFAEFFVRSSLIMPGDAAATAAQITAADGLFRSGIAADLTMILCDIAIALVFYVLLKPVSRPLALLAAFFRLTQAVILGVNLLNLFAVLQLLSGAEYLSAVGAAQLHAQALLLLEMHGIGYSLGLVFFGVSILLLGFLIVRSGYIPKLLGILLIAAAVGYLTDSFASFFLPTYANYETIFALVVFLPALIAELSLGLWLLFKGVKTAQVQWQPSYAA